MLSQPDGIDPQGHHSLSQLEAGWWPWDEQADTRWDLQHDVYTYLNVVGWCALVPDHVKHLPCEPVAFDNM